MKKKKIVIALGHEALGTTLPEQKEATKRTAKAVADFIREDYDKAAFMTAAKMGEEVGVSESTVVRFATALGYEGYPQFQRALGEMVRTKLNSIQRMEVTYGRISQGEIGSTVGYREDKADNGRN